MVYNSFTMEELETALCTAYSTSEESDEMRQESLDYLSSFIENKENIIPLIDNFSELSEHGQLFSFIFIKSILQKNIESEELLAKLQSFLFGEIIQLFNDFSTGEDILSLISCCQVMFVFETVPDKWSEFWDFLFPLMETNSFFVLCFLSSFCSILNTQKGEKKCVNSEICERIIQFDCESIVAYLQEQENECIIYKTLEIYSSVLYWACGYETLCDENIIKYLIDSMQTEDYKLQLLVFRALASIAEAPIDEEIKAEILNAIFLSGNLQVLASTCDNETILYYISLFTESAGFFFSSSQEMCTNFFRIALTFLAHSNKDVSLSVVSFIRFYLKMDNEIMQTVRNNVLFRMKLFYENFSIDDSDDDSIVQYRELLRECFEIDAEDSQQFLFGIIESIDALSELSFVSTILQILIEAEIVNDSALENFMCVFEIPNDHTPSLEEVLCFSAMSKYLTLFSSLHTGIIQAVFNFLSERIICTYNEYNSLNEGDEMVDCSLHLFIIKHLSEALKVFVDVYNENISIDAEVVKFFIEMKHEELADICSNVLHTSADSCNEIISFYMQYITSLCENPDDNLQTSVCCMLRFLGNLHDESIMQFYTLIQEKDFAKNDEMISLLITSIYRSFGPVSFDIIFGIVKDEMGVCTFRSFCEIIRKNADIINDKSFIMTFIGKLISNGKVILQKIDDDFVYEQCSASINSLLDIILFGSDLIVEAPEIMMNSFELLNQLFLGSTISCLPKAFTILSKAAASNIEIIRSIPVFNFILNIGSDEELHSTSSFLLFEAFFEFLVALKNQNSVFCHDYFDSEMTKFNVSDGVKTLLHEIIDDESPNVCDFTKFLFVFSRNIKRVV